MKYLKYFELNIQNLYCALDFKSIWIVFNCTINRYLFYIYWPS